tara:strand:+ start:3137 stop:6286 length:3150 start_codon:yes stop_codon:yes gene_type:complete
MAELTFKSPGVSTKEIDLSGPTVTGPSGVPAGVIGTADQGRAFVPITMATFSDFVAEFGNTDGTKFGPMAMRQWLQYTQAGTYLRVLGAGDGKKRAASGAVTNAGFIVGEQLPKGNGILGRNTYAGAGTSGGGALGRASFLAVCMSAPDGTTLPNTSNTYLTEAGLQASQPILRGVILAASGVLPALSASRAATATASTGSRGEAGYGGGLFSGNNIPLGAPTAQNLCAATSFGTAATKNAGSTLGAVDIAGGKQEFVLLLNGHTHTDSFPTVITASFDPQAPNYLANVLNTDPMDLQKAGHYLYTHYPVYSSFAVPTGSGLMNYNYEPAVDGLVGSTQKKMEDIAFLVTSSLGRNAGSATIPNFEGFRDRFRTAAAPKVISQNYGGSPKDLFRIWCLDDGAIGNHRVKISIDNIVKSTNVNNKYCVFDLAVRDFEDTDDLPVVIEKFPKLSLNPLDERYIARVIGDYHLYYDFDKRVGSQKLVVEGSYPNRSNYIRVEPVDALDKGEIPADAVPCGFRGIDHLVTSGSSIFKMQSADFAGDIGLGAFASADIVQPPVPLRSTVARGLSPRKVLASQLYWGIQFEKKQNRKEPNKSTVYDGSMEQWGTYFPNYAQTTQAALVGDNAGVADAGGTILDCDRFNNNKFSLENIQVIVTSADKADSSQWAAATYRRNGAAESMEDVDGTTKTTASGLTRLLSVEKDFGLSSARKFLKFSFLAQGGFDGLNIFDRNKFEMTSTACKREMDDSEQGETNGPTVASYRKALDILEQRADVNIQLLAIPGIRHESVTDYAITTVEDRFDALYIMDIEQTDTLGKVVTGSASIVSVTNTVADFQSRNLDSSFAAAYFPDVIMEEVNTGGNVVAPASVAVLGAFGLNDKIAYPWFAPAGFTRGALKHVREASVKLNRDNLDALYDVDINPITAFPQSKEVVVFGQKTLLAAQSALDRVNVRRLLIDIRRQVRAIGDTFLFEPNREATLARFSAAVNPILARIQQQQGLERFKVQIDATTTTQADIENNTVRGKIFLQPVRSVEFISLDFVVTNAGMDI